MDFCSSVIFILLFYNRFVVSEANFLRDKVSASGESLLQKLFKSNSIVKYMNPRLATIVGASRDQLDEIRPLLKSFPHSIADNAKKICSSRELAPDSLVLQFLSSLDVEYVTEVVDNLFNCQHTYILFIFGGTETQITESDIEFVLRLTWDKITKVPVFLNQGKTSVKFYGYGTTKANCTQRISLIMDWVPGLNIDKVYDWYTDFRRGLCPVKVGAPKNMPWMKYEENDNGALKIVGGFEGRIISTIAEKLNLPIEVQTFSPPEDDQSYVSEGLIRSCESGKTAVGIAHLRPYQRERETKILDISFPYTQECYVWCVPKTASTKFVIVTSEFSWHTWIFVGFIFLTSIVIEKVIRNKYFWNRGGRAGNSEASIIILEVVGMTPGNPIIYKPVLNGGRLLLLMYLFYSTVITTAYKTSLASLLTIENNQLSSFDTRQIIEANLTVGGHFLGLKVLHDQIEFDETVPELIKRYVVESNSTRALLRVSEEKDFAYLTTLSNLKYQSALLTNAGAQLSYRVFKCVLEYTYVMIFQKSSRYVGPMNEIIQRLLENGLIDYWREEYFPTRKSESSFSDSGFVFNTQKKLGTFTQENFYFIFTLYACCMIFCVMVFIGELIYHKLKSKKIIKPSININQPKLSRHVTFQSK